jgi:hypothetical protein
LHVVWLRPDELNDFLVGSDAHGFEEDHHLEKNGRGGEGMNRGTRVNRGGGVNRWRV